MSSLQLAIEAYKNLFKDIDKLPTSQVNKHMDGIGISKRTQEKARAKLGIKAIWVHSVRYFYWENKRRIALGPEVLLHPTAITPGGNEIPLGYVPGQENSMPMGELRDDVTIYIDGPAIIGVIGDLHAPYHHALADGAGALQKALKALKEANITHLLLNGDILDFYACSRHERDLSKRDLAQELKTGKALLKYIRDFFGPDVRIIFREGNHEERWWKYLVKASDERLAKTINAMLEADDEARNGDISYMEMFRLDKILGLKSLNIEWYDQRVKMKIGHLNVDHGHEWFGSGGVNPARNYLLKSFSPILVHHVHKTTDAVIKKPHSGELVSAHSVGCLCDLTPHYATRNQWTHGYAIVTVDESGIYDVDNRIILN